MRPYFIVPALRGLAGTLGVAMLLSSAAQAECYSAQQRVLPQVIGAFLGNPTDALRRYPQAGPQLAATIRDLAASDSATLPVILGLLANASKDHVTAIGSGLALAAKICVRTDQAYALKIQQAVAATKDEDVFLAFALAAGDVPTRGSVKIPESGFSSSTSGPGGVTGSVSK